MSHEANDIITDLVEDYFDANTAKIQEIAYLQVANEHIEVLKDELKSVIRARDHLASMVKADKKDINLLNEAIACCGGGCGAHLNKMRDGSTQNG